MLDITRVWLEDNVIKYIEYGNVSRENNSSNLVEIVSNFPLDYTIGISFKLPNGRFTRKYNTLSQLPQYISSEFENTELNQREITQDEIDNFNISQNKEGEMWDKRYFLFPSTLLKTLATVYSEALPFSLNVSKCLEYDVVEEEEVCKRWYRANTETANLSIFPTITGEFDEIEVDLATVQQELTNLYDLVSQTLSEFQGLEEDFEQVQSDITDLFTFYDTLNDEKLEKSGSNADVDININCVTFNHARATDAIQGSEYDSRVTTVDNRFDEVEDDIDDIYELLDLDGDL